MTFSIDNPEGGCNNPPLGKYVWEKPSGEQGLRYYVNSLFDKIDRQIILVSNSINMINIVIYTINLERVKSSLSSELSLIDLWIYAWIESVN